MTRGKIFIGGLLGIVLICAGALFAQRSLENIDAHRHSNLAAAQHHMAEAFEKLGEAQKEYKEQLGGHAEKAKELLEQASRETKEAADYVDQHHK